MLDFTDQPYQFVGPQANVPIAALTRLLNRCIHLPRTQKIVQLQVTNSVEPDVIGDPRTRLVLIANHPTHADASIMLEACRRVGIWPRFMASHDVFQRGMVHRFLLRHLGAFSVNRDGSERESLDCALRILRMPPGWGKRPALTIFPQGNVYLENDRVGEFLEGAAFLACRSAKEQTGDTRVLAVPVAIKATYWQRDPARQEVIRRLERLETMLDIESPGDQILPRLTAVGLSALRRNLAHRGWPVPDEGLPLRLQIESAAVTVLDDLENKMNLAEQKSASIIDRIRRVRRGVHEIRTDPARIADHAAAGVWADHAMVALRIASYSGDYVAESLSLDRVSETVEKLEEDVTRTMPSPLAERHVFVNFGPPIDVSQVVQSVAKLRLAARELTDRSKSEIQWMLDEINESNPHPGGQPF